MVNQAAGRPWPVICEDDDVVDFMIMEAVALKMKDQEKKEHDRVEKKKWMRDKQGLDNLRGI